MGAFHRGIWRALGAAALLISVSLSGVLGPARAQAASAKTVSASSAVIAVDTVAAQAPIVRTKVTLPETSIGAPALWTNPPLGEPGAGAFDPVAWTGTDTAHHVNLMRFSFVNNAVSFTHKEILPETSIAGPALTVQPSQNDPARYFVAWTGTNAAHSLNVICDGCASSRVKLTLRNETSFAAPALAMLSGNLMLAWTGDDANHSLNILPISITDGRLVPGVKTTMREFGSDAGPALIYEPNVDVGKGLLLSWQDRATAKIRAALSATGTDWSMAGRFTYTEWSHATPNLLIFAPMSNVPGSYLGWTGTDEAHSLNLLYPAYPPRMSATKATLDETALGGPTLGYIGDGKLALMWTGTDRLHHLNFAALDV